MVHRVGTVVGALLILGGARIRTATRAAGEPMALYRAVDFTAGRMANLVGAAIARRRRRIP